MKTIQHNWLVENIEEYLLVCKIEGKSESTITNYRNSLKRFMKATTEVIQTDPRLQVMSFLASISSLQPASRNKLFSETKRFFVWAVLNGRIGANPFDGFKNVRIPEKIRNPFSVDDVNHLLKATSGSSDREIRDTAIVMIFVDTGLRLSELVGINFDDIDFSSGRILIKNAKGGNQRVVPYANRCAEAITRYVNIRSASAGPLFWAATPQSCLIPNVPLLAAGVRAALLRLAATANVHHVYPHRFRHTFATWSVRNNAREIDVQHLLGHRSASMVRRYTMTYRSEQAAERHKLFSPGDCVIGVHS